jgi:hypothetical protein
MEASDMMGRKSGQIEMLICDLEEIIPRNHLLRKIDKLVSFEFVYTLLQPTYAEYGRPPSILSAWLRCCL